MVCMIRVCLVRVSSFEGVETEFKSWVHLLGFDFYIKCVFYSAAIILMLIFVRDKKMLPLTIYTYLHIWMDCFAHV